MVIVDLFSNFDLLPIINAYEAKECSQRQLAKRFQVSLSFVKRLIRRYQDTAEVKPL
ncbi:MAG: hypothetical protein F6K63_01740 [Moorea sp. SIO1G6]|uniref:hypothetical protein n=1 Tax=Moorena sp. SIO1G6 TaxID=2607840 RepID=UPI0013BF1B3A|nr:hypothetical protein [Moorena sp. SIO1G6]NET63188.1 hypothetical protein [Moorena sp. SIO1G6]